MMLLQKRTDTRGVGISNRIMIGSEKMTLMDVHVLLNRGVRGRRSEREGGRGRRRREMERRRLIANYIILSISEFSRIFILRLLSIDC